MQKVNSFNIPCLIINIFAIVTFFKNCYAKLSNSISQIAKKEGDKNQIDTVKEKNQVSELLAGARQEIGDFFSVKEEELNKKRLTHDEYNKQSFELAREEK